MTVTCTETAECNKWAEIVALAQQGNKKMLGVILQAFDIKLRKIAHTSAYKGFAEDGEQIERIAVVKALEKWGQRQDFEKLPAFIVSKSYTAISSEWKRRHKDEEMTCPYEIESGCEFAEEVLTAAAACGASGRKTAGSGRTADVDKLEYGSSGAGRQAVMALPARVICLGKCVCSLDRETRKCA